MDDQLLTSIENRIPHRTFNWFFSASVSGANGLASANLSGVVSWWFIDYLGHWTIEVFNKVDKWTIAVWKKEKYIILIV